MKKRYCSLLLIALSVWMLSACGNRADVEEKNLPEHTSSGENISSIEKADGNTENAVQETPETMPEEHAGSIAEEIEEHNEEAGGKQMPELIIGVGGRQFQTTIYDSKTARALMEMLPMTLNMEELHGNEKFYYLDEELPVNSENVDRIRTGDIMLFGSDCLVLFFDDFGTSYSYTRIGHIEDEEAFADALGDGTVEVTFKAGE